MEGSDSRFSIARGRLFMSQGASQKACALPLYLPYRNANFIERTNTRRVFLKVTHSLQRQPANPLESKSVRCLSFQRSSNLVHQRIRHVLLQKLARSKSQALHRECNTLRTLIETLQNLQHSLNNLVSIYLHTRRTNHLSKILYPSILILY